MVGPTLKKRRMQMSRRFLVSICILTIILLATLSVAGQAPATGAKAQPAAKAYKAPRTPDGQPDLQGYWTNATYVPLERPNGVTKEFYSKEEAVQLEKRAAERETEQTEPGTVADVHYDFTQFGLDRNQSTFASSMRTSMIMDPADGAHHRRRAEHADRHTLHHHGGFRTADDELRLQRQLSNCAGSGIRDDSHRDDPRRSHHPPRRASACFAKRPAVDGRLARPLGGRDAGCRNDKLQREEPVPRGQPEHEGNGTVHAHGRQ